MNLILKRTSIGVDGIFGELMDEKYNFLWNTLEHAYVESNGTITPKVAPGVYTCVRGMHKLENGIPFSTFEIKHVPDFEGIPVTGILFHILNYNQESKGCCGLGMGIGAMSNGGKMLTSSAIAFGHFINMQQGLNEFQLTIES